MRCAMRCICWMRGSLLDNEPTEKPLRLEAAGGKHYAEGSLHIQILRAPELGEGAVLGDELVAVSELRDVAALHHGDQIGVFYRGELVGDDDAGAAFGQLVERRLNALLRDGVERTGGLVRNEYGRCTHGFG